MVKCTGEYKKEKMKNSCWGSSFLFMDIVNLCALYVNVVANNALLFGCFPGRLCDCFSIERRGIARKLFPMFTLCSIINSLASAMLYVTVHEVYEYKSV